MTYDKNTETTTNTTIEALDEISRYIHHVEHVIAVAVDGREYKVTIENQEGHYTVTDVVACWDAGDDINYLEEMDEELTQAEDIDEIYGLDQYELDELLRVC